MTDEKLISIGQIVKPHGIKGEVKVNLLTHNPEHFVNNKEMFLMDKFGNLKMENTVKIESARIHKKAVLLKMDIMNAPEEIDKYRGCFLALPFSKLPKPQKDEYYFFDMIGMQVFTESGQEVGSLTNIIDGGGNDIYEIKNPQTGKTNYVPARKQFIKSVDINEKKMIITPIEGLLEL